MMRRVLREIDSRVIVGAFLLLVAAILPIGAFRGFAGILAGALVTVAVGQYYHRRASRELRSEAEALRRESEEARHYTDALITHLESAGVIEVVRRSPSGRPGKRWVRVVESRVGPIGTSASYTLGGGDSPSDKEAKPGSKSVPTDE